MSYPVKFRERAVEYYHEGHTLKETAAIFGITVRTLCKWRELLIDKGNLEPKELHRTFKKIDPEKLRAYVAEHPDAYQREIAADFGCSQEAVRKALKRLRITRKKRPRALKSRIRKK